MKISQSAAQSTLFSPPKINTIRKQSFAADLPVVLQVADLLPQLLQAGQSLRFPQLHPDQLLLETGHVGVVWERGVPLGRNQGRMEEKVRDNRGQRDPISPQRIRNALKFLHRLIS